MTSNERNDLGLKDASATGGGCADGQCNCGGGATSADNAAAGTTAATRTELAVTGMTCAHCVSSVTEELSEVVGVDSVIVDLEANGTSRVSVLSAAPIEPALLQAAVEEAGYTLVSTSA